MAEAYQLPGPFQLPSIPQASFNVADERATADASFNQFTDQIRQYTNINNANREVSLREKEFLRKVVENDRDYDLKAEEQNQNIRIGNLNYEINKFAYDNQRKNYVQLQDAWEKKEEWQNTIDKLAPNGGNSPTYLTDRARAFRLLAKNPADFQVLQAIFDPYDKQYAVFEKTKSIENEAEIQSAFDRGEMDDEFIGETPAPDYYRSILQLQFSDPVGYQAGLRNLKRISARKQREEESAIKAEQNVRDLGALNALAQAQGLAGQPSRIAMKDGKVEFEVGSTRVYGTSRAGTSSTSGGVKTYEKADIDFLDSQIKSVETSIGELDDKIAKEDSELRKAGLQAEKEGLLAKKQSLQKTMDMGVQLLQQKVATQLPQATGQPQTTPGRATPQKILKAPSFPVPAGTPRQPATTPTNPVSSTPTTTGGAVIGYVSEEGMRLTEAEAKARQAAGQQVYPIRPPVVANPFGAPVTSEGIKASVSG